MTHTLSCAWAPAGDPLYRAYHDTEWGVPEYDSRALWEKLQRDGMQAGLAWITILRKRHTIRAEFDDFDPVRIADWDEARIAKALQNPGIIRSRRKIEACIGNARAYLAAAERGEDFSRMCWSHVSDKPVIHALTDYREGPTQTEISQRLSTHLKRAGYKFVGPTIVYAWMQACGLYNDHEVDCPRFEQVKAFYR